MTCWPHPTAQHRQAFGGQGGWLKRPSQVAKEVECFGSKIATGTFYWGKLELGPTRTLLACFWDTPLSTLYVSEMYFLKLQKQAPIPTLLCSLHKNPDFWVSSLIVCDLNSPTFKMDRSPDHHSSKPGAAMQSPVVTVHMEITPITKSRDQRWAEVTKTSL